MKINIETYSDEFLTKDEALGHLKAVLGDSVNVSVRPDSETPYAYLYHALQELAVRGLIPSLIDSHEDFRDFEINKFKESTLNYIRDEVLSRVIEDIVEKVT